MTGFGRIKSIGSCRNQVCHQTGLFSVYANARDFYIGSISPIERPFSPDTTKDFGDSWNKRQEDQVTPTTTKLAKPNALMFFHIPLYVTCLLMIAIPSRLVRPESYTPADADPRTGKPLDVGIHGEEAAGNAKGTDGFFEKALLTASESEHVSSGTEHEVKVVANGHCHRTQISNRYDRRLYS